MNICSYKNQLTINQVTNMSITCQLIIINHIQVKRLKNYHGY